MKLVLSWLEEYVRLTPSDRAAIQRRLPEIGVEVAAEESVEGETVLEIEGPANRGDILSVFGMAREIAAVLGRKIKPPAVKLARRPALRGAVRIDRNSGCRKYFGARIENVRVGPAPEAIAKKLRLAGFAVFNNVVDTTNVLLAEFGQPLHTFDADKLSGPVHVRRAGPGEKIAALDGKTYEVAGDLVISDSRGPVALAGVIGGAESAVTDSTRTVFLECAWFEPSTVRRTSRRLGITTESSFRFERQVDPAGMERVFFRAIQLIEELTGGKLAGIEMVGSAPKPPAPVTLSADAADRLLGIRPPSARIARSLSVLGCKVTAVGKDRWTVTPPSYRPDLQLPEDLIEEVSRMYGIDRIPARRPIVTPARPASDNQTTIGRVRDAAMSQGLTETVHMSFVSEDALKSVGIYPEEAVRLENPLSLAVSHLRPTLLPGILSTASLNLRRGATTALRLFEIGPVFLPPKTKSAGEAPVEEWRMAVVLSGEAEPVHFSGRVRQSDFFDLKGILENLLQSAGRKLAPVETLPAAIAGFDPAAAAALKSGDLTIGCLGRIASTTAQKFDLPPEVFAAELSLSRVLTFDTVVPVHRPIPRFPSIGRDLSLMLSGSVKASEVERTIREARVPNLVKFEIFDLYRGKGIPDGSYAIGVSFVFQSPDRTLSDEEANAARDSILELLGSRLDAKLRAG